MPQRIGTPNRAGAGAAAAAVALALLMLLAVHRPGATTPAQPEPPSSAAPPVRFEVKGTVTSVRADGATLTILPEGPGAQGPLVIRMVAGGTVVVMDDGVSTEPHAAQPGDRVPVWGWRYADGALTAGRVHVLGRRAGGASAGIARAEARSTIRGVIVGRAPAVSLLTEQGTVRVVVLTAATRVNGQRSSSADLRVYDIVSADGTVNADGSITAIRISVEFAATSAARVTGVISQVTAESSLVLGPSTWVNLLPETWIVQGTSRRSPRDLVPGTAVTVYGTTSAGGPRPTVIAARLIVISR
ncbi:MAG: hypothetical protein HY660_06125 [Armatimonadetes bacterium]|nr:hypothetical protein [Armatimonadota bacterium]